MTTKDILRTLEEVRDVVLSISNTSYAQMTIDSAINTATDISDDLHNVHTTTNKVKYYT